MNSENFMYNKISKLIMILIEGIGLMATEPKMTKARIIQTHIPGWRIKFCYPANSLDPDLQRKIPENDIYIKNPESFENRKAISIAHIPISYSGHFWQGVYGTVIVDLGVYRCMSDQEDDYTNEKTLRRVIAHLMKDDPPSFTSIKSVNLSGIKGVQGVVKTPPPGMTPIFKDSMYILVPLGKNYALELSFRYIPNNDRYPNNPWRQKADKITDEIIKSVEIFSTEDGITR